MVAVNQLPLAERVTAFRKSSAFTPGDPYSFKVRIGDGIELPGKHDPITYLDFTSGVAGRVAVICPGNGGLCTELLRRGCAVVAFEPRNQYFKAIQAVAGFVENATGKTFEVHTNTPSDVDGQFDVIFWSEGLEDLRDPKIPLEQAVARLVPGGTLYIEVHHGAHGVLPGSINSWRPAPVAFEDSIKKIGGCNIKHKSNGRNVSRMIYCIKDSREPVVEQADAPKVQRIKVTKQPAAEIAVASEVLAIPTVTEHIQTVVVEDKPANDQNCGPDTADEIDFGGPPPSEAPITPRKRGRPRKQL